MNKEGTAYASADEGMASEEVAVDNGEQFKEGESSQDQYHPFALTV